MLAEELPWSAHAWVPLVLSLLSLLDAPGLPKFGVGSRVRCRLATAGYFMAVALLVTMPSGWLLAGMLLAVVWLVLGRDLVRVEPGLCRRLGIGEVGAGDVVEIWSLLVSSIAGGRRRSWWVLKPCLQSILAMFPRV